ncbi:MAG: GDP-mannose 4,6-dehydratase [Bacteroidota bacterium]
MQQVLITGGAGFIGSSLADQLIAEGYWVTAVDNFDPFYEEEVKRKNIEALMAHPRFKLVEADICDLPTLREQLTDSYAVVVHIAAKAGVHASVKDPIGCQQANVMGTQNLLELAKEIGIKQFVFASSSSVYGVNPNVPWREEEELMPISPYASSKLSCELLGHVYTHLYGIRFLALRFFTVYGPRQRPDLAIHKFARMIINKVPLTMYGDGSTRRDYTYIDDLLKGIRAAMNYIDSDYEIINLGNHRTVSLKEMISTIEKVFEEKAIIQQLPMQPGDVPQTFADISKAQELLGYQPHTTFEEGIRQFRDWMISLEIG